jgi:hypothetical protein
MFYFFLFSGHVLAVCYPVFAHIAIGFCPIHLACLCFPKFIMVPVWWILTASSFLSAYNPLLVS